MRATVAKEKRQQKYAKQITYFSKSNIVLVVQNVSYKFKRLFTSTALSSITDKTYN